VEPDGRRIAVLSISAVRLYYAPERPELLADRPDGLPEKTSSASAPQTGTTSQTVSSPAAGQKTPAPAPAPAPDSHHSISEAALAKAVNLLKPVGKKDSWFFLFGNGLKVLLRSLTTNQHTSVLRRFPGPTGTCRPFSRVSVSRKAANTFSASRPAPRSHVHLRCDHRGRAGLASRRNVSSHCAEPGFEVL
jgi:hypothetical protein